MQKTAEPIEMPFRLWIRMSPRKHVLHGGAHWRNLANTIESSMCGGYATFLSNYIDNAFINYKLYKLHNEDVSVSAFADLKMFISCNRGTHKHRNMN